MFPFVFVCILSDIHISPLGVFCRLQVQVLLYYLQHPPITFTELKRNTLYFSTDV